jgi:hypothetical protein
MCGVAFLFFFQLLIEAAAVSANENSLLLVFLLVGLPVCV